MLAMERALSRAILTEELSGAAPVGAREMAGKQGHISIVPLVKRLTFGMYYPLPPRIIRCENTKTLKHVLFEQGGGEWIIRRKNLDN